MMQPAKPKVCRLFDGRIGIFVGSAYQFTDDAGARTLRDQIDAILPPMGGGAALEGDFCQQLEREVAARGITQGKPE